MYVEINMSLLHVSLDVTGLYTNISGTLGIDAVRFWMEIIPEGIDDRFSKFMKYMLECLELIVENNNFQFDKHSFSSNQKDDNGH